MTTPYKSIKIFENPVLEKMTHVHPIVPLALWLPVSSWLLWHSIAVLNLSLPWVIGVGFLGVVTWTLTEYLLHRFLFHYEAEGPISQKFHFLVHGIHHADPSDPSRLVMPPVASLILSLCLYNLFKYVFGPMWVEPFFACFVLGYLCYDYIHYYVHQGNPTTRIGKYLKHSHMIHHYANPNSRWGVSTPFWDYVFGTMEGAKDKRQAV